MLVATGNNKVNRRRGLTVVSVGVALLLIMGLAALTVDVGIMYRARGEAQQSADAGSMSAAWRLLDQDRLRGADHVENVILETRQDGAAVAYENAVVNLSPVVALNAENDPGGDIVLGRLNRPNDPTEEMSFDGDPADFNAVRVLLRRDGVRNGPISLYFASLLGHHEKDISASATAAFYDGVVGWRVTDKTGNAGLLPFALKKTAWEKLLGGELTTGDNFAYDADTGDVSAGADGILELNLYPGSGEGQLPPGNFGTVDIGSPNNSTNDIARQIREGVNEEDLSYFGGTLRLGSDGTLPLNGDTGLSAGFKDDLASIIGQPRAIPIFTEVSGPGNNATFTVVGFVGVRILSVKLTGPMSGKRVIIQPAYLVDDAVIVGEQNGQSRYVYQPVVLVR